MSDLALTKVTETGSTITFSYPKVAGCEGYQYYADGQKVSRTFDPDKLTVKFSKGHTSYRVVPLDVSERTDGFVWPAPSPGPTEQPYWREDFSTRPATWWQYVSGSSAVYWGDPAFNLVSNGEGGSALQIGGSGPGGAGVFGAMWNGSNQVHGMQGEIWMSTRVRFDGAFNGFWWEHHENFNRYTNNSVYSCALAFNIAGDRKLSAQTTGGPYINHVGGQRGTQTTDSQSLEVGRWYRIIEHMILSPDHSKGLHESWVDDRLWFRHQRGTLLSAPDGAVDQLAFGLYAYPWRATPSMNVQFDYLAQGPTKASVDA